MHRPVERSHLQWLIITNLRLDVVLVVGICTASRPLTHRSRRFLDDSIQIQQGRLPDPVVRWEEATTTLHLSHTYRSNTSSFSTDCVCRGSTAVGSMALQAFVEMKNRLPPLRVSGSSGMRVVRRGIM